jgi:hypothetical protein
MPGPVSAPGGYRHDPGLTDKHPTPHGKCQDRERCTGPGCRVRTGKTRGERWERKPTGTSIDAA